MNEFEEACLVRATLRTSGIFHVPLADYNKFSDEGLKALLATESCRGRLPTIGLRTHTGPIFLRWDPGPLHFGSADRRHAKPLYTGRVGLTVSAAWPVPPEAEHYVAHFGNRFRTCYFPVAQADLAFATVRALLKMHSPEAA